jgi:hypothetical protein
MSKATLPQRIFAQASPRSRGGPSLFDAGAVDLVDRPLEFTSEAGVQDEAASRLRAAGFEVLNVAGATINIAGPPELYERVFSTTLVAEERPVLKPFNRRDTATIIDTLDTERSGLIDTSRSRLADVLEGVAIEEPMITMELPWPPITRYWHLDVPADVSVAVRADQAHRAAITGRGVRVAMVDTGWYAHPFFRERGYRGSVILGPGATAPFVDRNGHGTGESANVFAVAPDVDFTMVKLDLRNAIGAFNAAAALRPDVISCSWSADVRDEPLSAAAQALAVAVSLAVAEGIIVVFSAGNGHFGFPAQHPDVIAAGGVYMDSDGSLRASDYASGFESRIYPGRKVPDVSGVVGAGPIGAYILLPVQSWSAIDAELAGGTHPDADETAGDDGWAAFSGTSAAAPQIAGACALIKQKIPDITPAQARELLMAGARDVSAGTNHPRMGPESAAAGYDLATGAGLLDVWAALAPLPGNDVLAYDSVDGRAELVSFAGGQPTHRSEARGWRPGWTHIVPCELGGARRRAVLFYDAARGHGELYAFDDAGVFAPVAGTEEWRPGWSHILAGDFGGGEQSDLLFYDATSGRGEIYAVGSDGSMTLAASSVRWRIGWSLVIAGEFTGSERDDLLFYEAARGRAELYAVGADGGLNRQATYRDWSRDWSHIVAGDFGSGRRRDLLFYAPAAGRGDVFAIATDGTISPRWLGDGWGRGWSRVVAGRFTSALHSDVLFYDGREGRCELYGATPEGRLERIAEDPASQPGWSHLIAVDAVARGATW